MARRRRGFNTKKSKRANERIHAKRRAWERYKLVLTNQNLKEIQEQISAQTDAQLIQRVSRRVARWRIVYQKMLIDVIYDIKRSTIVTFLYPD